MSDDGTPTADQLWNARLRGWLRLIQKTGDPHSIACARHALAGDPVPERTRNNEEAST